MRRTGTLNLEPLDFDELGDAAAAADRYGDCPVCEEPDRLLCWCGVCLRDCHDDFYHEDEPLGPESFP
jgi:hypothetical protein